MDESPQLKERLLEDYSTEEPVPPTKSRPTSLRRYATTILVSVLIILLSTYNIYLVVQNNKLQKQGRSSFAGLTYDTPVRYSNRTDYWSVNETLADNLWDNLDIDPLVVALTDEYARSKGLPISVFRFPWDDSKGTYYLKAFHGLHCLKSMRKAFIDYERGNPQVIHSGHIYHCFDALRQDIMCSADDTPMPGVELPHEVGNGQVRMCRNWDKLLEWIHGEEREACYHRITDYKSIKHPLERYAFCPEGSRYEWVQKAYFEKWGHKDLYN